MQIRNGRVILLFVLLVGGAGFLAWFATRPPGESAAERAPERTGEPEAPGRLPPLAPAVIRGEVRIFKGNEPAAKIPVEVTGGRRTVRAATTEDGTFRVEADAGRELTVTVQAPEPYAPVVVRGLRLVPGRTENLGTLYLERAFLVKGIVVDREGNPVPGAAVRALRPTLERGRVNFLDLFFKFGSTRTPLEETRSGADGTFVLAKLSPGIYRLEATGQGFAVGYIARAVVNPETESQLFRIVLAPGLSLPGTVKSVKGEPVPGATVTAVRFGRGRRGPSLELEPVQTTTDERGAFVLDHLTPGPAQLMVAAEGFPTRVEGDVVIGETKRLDVVLGGGAAIEGRITDSKGNPVEGAEVAVFLGPGSPVFGRTRSDADGHYLLDRLPSGRIQIFLVRKDGYPPYPTLDLRNMYRQPREELEEGKTLVKNVTLESGAVIRGRVTNGADGSPVAEAEIVAVGSALFGGLGGSVSGTTDENGDYRLTGVGPGLHLLLVKAPGFYQPGTEAQALLRSMAPFGNTDREPGPDDPVVRVGKAGTETVKDLKMLPGAVVSGRVLAPDGTPLAGASVAPAAGDRGFAFLLRFLNVGPGSVMTGEDGSFRFSGVAASEKLVLEARAPGYLPSKSDPVSVSSGAEVTGLEIRLKAGGTVTGTVYGADGAPFSGASVKVVPDLRDPRDRWRTASALWRAEAVTTDGEGAFRVDGLEPGPVLIDVQAPGHQPLRHRGVSVSEGTVTGGVTLRLEKGYVIAGRVTDPGGNPLEAVRVRADVVRERRVPPVFPLGGAGNSAVTGADGAYRLDRLAPGNYRLRFSKGRYVPETRDAVAAGTEGLEVILEKGLAITGTVTWPDGSPAAGISVAARRGERSASSTSTDAKGAFRLENLKAGAYDLTASPTRSPFGRVREDVPDAAPATLSGVTAGAEGVEIRLLPAFSISGVVADEAGNPLPGVMLFATTEGGGPRPTGFARTDDRGAFRIPNLAEGTYAIRAMKQGYTLPDPSSPPRAQAGATGLRIVLKKGPDVPRMPGPQGPVRRHGRRVLGPAALSPSRAGAPTIGRS